MTLKKRPTMHISWFEALQSEFSDEYVENLRNFFLICLLFFLAKL